MRGRLRLCAFAAKNKPIGVYLHGVLVLTTAGVVKDAPARHIRRLVRRDIAGGKYVEIAVDQAHVDGNLITAPAWPAHPAWLANLLIAVGE